MKRVVGPWGWASLISHCWCGNDWRPSHSQSYYCLLLGPWFSLPHTEGGRDVKKKIWHSLMGSIDLSTFWDLFALVFSPTFLFSLLSLSPYTPLFFQLSEPRDLLGLLKKVWVRGYLHEHVYPLLLSFFFLTNSAGIEPRTSHMQDPHSTPGLHALPLLYLLFWDKAAPRYIS